MRTRLAGVLTAAALLTPATASAQWSPPESFRADRALGFSADGRTVTGLDQRGSSTLGAAVAPSGAVGPTRRLAVFTGRALAGKDPLVVGQPGPEPSGPVLTSSRRRLVRRSASPLLAVDAAAPRRAAVVTLRCVTRSCGRAEPVLVVKRGRGFGRPVALDRVQRLGRFREGVAVAVNEAGDALAVWQRGSRVLARIRTAGGRLLARQDLGRVNREATLSADLGTGRRAVVAAGGQETDGLGEAAQPYEAWVAVARAGRPFAPRSRVARVPGANTPAGGIRAVLPESGLAVVAWTGREGGRFVVRARKAGPGRVRPAETLSDPAQDSHVAGLAAADDGRVAVTWLSSPSGPPDDPGNVVSLSAALMDAGGAFEPAEAVTTEPVGSYLRVPTAFDPAGSLHVAYEVRDGTAVATRRR